MKNDILEAIAVNSIFGIDEVHRVYEIFKSYDLLVAACQLAQKVGYSNLECACMLSRLTNKMSSWTGLTASAKIQVFLLAIWD